MPVYNGERFLREAVESVLNQTLRELELIAVDDGSTDSSLDILTEYARTDPRVVIVRRKHAGLPAALNAGIRQAKYDLIARLDSDDRMLPNRLERQLWFLAQRPEAAVVCSDCFYIDINGKRLGQSACRVDVERGCRERELALFLDIVHPTVMMQKRFIEEAGGYREDLSYGEDRELWGQMVTGGMSIECQGENLIEYRMHGGAMTMSRAAEQDEICGWLNENVLRRLDARPELTREQYRAWRRQRSLLTKVRHQLGVRSIHSFKMATRFYGERRYLPFVLSLATAITFDPIRIVRRLHSRLLIERKA